MSGLSGGGTSVDNNKPMSSIPDGLLCDKLNCNNVATMKPVVQLRESPVHNCTEAFMNLQACTECATEEAANELINIGEQRLIFENIFKVQTQSNKKVDWSCSGVVWVRIQ